MTTNFRQSSKLNSRNTYDYTILIDLNKPALINKSVVVNGRADVTSFDPNKYSSLGEKIDKQSLKYKNRAEMFLRHSLVSRRGFWADGTIRDRNGNIIARMEDRVYFSDNILGAYLSLYFTWLTPEKQNMMIFEDEAHFLENIIHFKKDSDPNKKYSNFEKDPLDLESKEILKNFSPAWQVMVYIKNNFLDDFFYSLDGRKIDSFMFGKNLCVFRDEIMGLGDNNFIPDSIGKHYFCDIIAICGDLMFVKKMGLVKTRDTPYTISDSTKLNKNFFVEFKTIDAIIRDGKKILAKGESDPTYSIRVNFRYKYPLNPLSDNQKEREAYAILMALNREDKGYYGKNTPLEYWSEKTEGMYKDFINKTQERERTRAETIEDKKNKIITMPDSMISPDGSKRGHKNSYGFKAKEIEINKRFSTMLEADTMLERQGEMYSERIFVIEREYHEMSVALAMHAYTVYNWDTETIFKGVNFDETSGVAEGLKEIIKFKKRVDYLKELIREKVGKNADIKKLIFAMYGAGVLKYTTEYNKDGKPYIKEEYEERDGEASTTLLVKKYDYVKGNAIVEFSYPVITSEIKPQRAYYYNNINFMALSENKIIFFNNMPWFDPELSLTKNAPKNISDIIGREDAINFSPADTVEFAGLKKTSKENPVKVNFKMADFFANSIKNSKRIDW